ncbi:MAG: zinc-binding dehydrogenase [Anaerolineales bacterium]|nr:zinc-binding dehydrogenase [Anaerolineales bacterium]
MHAAFFRQHGGPEVMEYGDLPEPPPPGPGEVLVAVKAAAMNRLDKWVRDGWPGLKLELPHITGSDAAGVVIAVGAHVSGWQPGDRVCINSNVGCGECSFCVAGRDNLCERWHLLGESKAGLAAERVVVPARQLLRVPEAFPLEQAAAAGLVYQTAWHSLITRGGLQAGESVLIVGAGGGVNTASIQIAKLAGCTVYVVGSDARKLELARSLGADVLIDRSQVDWGKEVFRLTNRRGVDVVVDNVGAATLMTSLRAARKGGRILTVGNTSGPKFEFDNRFMFARHLSFIGSTMSTRAEYATVMGLVFAGKLKPVIDSVFPLSEIRAAHEKMERGDVMGKIVLQVAG